MTRDPLPFPPLTRARCLARYVAIMQRLPDHSLTASQHVRLTLAEAYRVAADHATR